MFTYIRSAFASRFDHGILASMYVVAAFLAVFGVILELLIQPALGFPSSGVTVGFVGVYAIFFASIGTIGYGALYLGRLVSKARDRMGPAAG